jgi:hypothetical protein
MGKPRGHLQGEPRPWPAKVRSRTVIPDAAGFRLMNCISSIGKARLAPWNELHVGQSLSELFALGFTAWQLSHRMRYSGLAFEPPLLPGAEVTQLFYEWRVETGLIPPKVEVPVRRPPKAPQQRKRRKPKPGKPLPYTGRAFDEALPPPPPLPVSIMRKCLCCRRTFEAEGRFNRLCIGCLRVADHMSSAIG